MNKKQSKKTTSGNSRGNGKPKARSGPPSPTKDVSKQPKSNSTGSVAYSQMPAVVDSASISKSNIAPIFLLGTNTPPLSSRQQDNHSQHSQSLDQLLYQRLDILAQERSKQSASRLHSGDSLDFGSNNNSSNNNNNNNSRNTHHHQQQQKSFYNQLGGQGPARDTKANKLGLSPSLMLNRNQDKNNSQSWSSTVSPLYPGNSTPYITSPRLDYNHSNSNSSTPQTTPQVPKKEAERLLMDVRQESKKVHKTSQLFLIFLLRINGSTYRQKSFIPLNATADFDALFAQFVAKHTKPQQHGQSLPSIDRFGYVLQHRNVYVALPGMDQVRFNYLRWHLMRANALDQQDLGSGQDWPMEQPSTDFATFAQLEQLLNSVVAVARSQREDMPAQTVDYEQDLARAYHVQERFFRVPQASQATRYDGASSNAVCLGTSVTWTGRPESLVNLLIDQDADICEARLRLQAKKEQLRRQRSRQEIDALQHKLMETLRVTEASLAANEVLTDDDDDDDAEKRRSEIFYENNESSASSYNSDEQEEEEESEIVVDDWEQLSFAPTMLDVEIAHDSQLLKEHELKLKLELTRQGLNECRNLDYVLGHQKQLTAFLIEKMERLRTDAAYADFRVVDCRLGGNLSVHLQEVLQRLDFLMDAHAQVRNVALHVSSKVREWSEIHAQLDRQSKEPRGE